MAIKMKKKRHGAENLVFCVFSSIPVSISELRSTKKAQVSHVETNIALYYITYSDVRSVTAAQKKVRNQQLGLFCSCCVLSLRVICMWGLPSSPKPYRLESRLTGPLIYHRNE